ncbi:MAG: cation:proton antiporter [Propionibacteriaceae bacterium]|nr:cation:proton antiporter [Propionibacteriaceae bacterium]
MTFALLALIVAVGLFGPLLGWSNSWRVPVVVGELAAGVLIGHTGFHWVNPTEPTFSFLANIGFAMVMFVAGSRVPVRDKALRTGARAALVRLVIVVVLGIVLAWIVSSVFGTRHVGLYAVLFVSSSAAVILPMTESLKLSGPAMLAMLPQVAIADALCIVALPLALDPGNALHVGLGVAAVIGCGVVVTLALWLSEKRGWRTKVHRKSEQREFALELRISLLILLLMAALAQVGGVSIMLAGFCLGLALAVVGQPRRLARQLFALTEGLFGPIFFVWLGASLNLRALAAYPQMILLGVVLAAGAIAAHAATVINKQPLSYGVLSAAQLGVPVAAATLGDQLGFLHPGEDAALLLGALLTIVAATIAGRWAARPTLSGSSAPDPELQPT